MSSSKYFLIFLLFSIISCNKIDIPVDPDEPGKEPPKLVNVKFKNFAYSGKPESADFYIGDKLYENLIVKDSVIVLDNTIEGTIKDITFYKTINSKRVAIDWYSSEAGITIPSKKSDTLVYISDQAGGDGTLDNPYLISNPRQLDRIRLMPFSIHSCYIKLIKDIDLKDACTIDGAPFYNNGKGWIAINDLNGGFNGNKHTISGLTIKEFAPYDRVQHRGLFGITSNVEIFDLKLSNVNIDLISAFHMGFYYAGALIGITSGNVKLENVHISNVIIKDTPEATYTYKTDGSRCGSLVGFGAEGLTIKNCSVKDSEISCPGNQESIIGGLISVGNVIDIQNCYVECNLEGDICGGIAGFTNPYITKKNSNCYLTGTMKNDSDYKAGGIVGINSYSWSFYVYSSCTAFKYKTSGLSKLTLAKITDYDLDRVDFQLNCTNYALENTIEGNNYAILEPENVHYNGNNMTAIQRSSADFFKSAPLLWDFTNIWKMSIDGTHPELIGF